MTSSILAFTLLAGFPSSTARASQGEAATDVEAWEGWVDEALTGRKVEKDYSTMEVADGRVWIAYPKGASKSKLKSGAAKTVAAFDELFDPASREEGAPAPRTALLFPLAGRESFAAITTRAAELVPRLGGWAQAAPKGVGFLLDEPLVAGWLLHVPENEVWSVENELANRLARLLTIERFGRQPHWLAQGLAWQLEIEVCKDVYCFPYRQGFVSKKEHRSWPRRLPELMEARGERPLAAADLFGWPRNSWDEARAFLAWGAARLLAKHYPEELARILVAYRELREKDGRMTSTDGSWTVIPDYEIPADEGLAILDRETGVDFLAELERFTRKPKTYRRPR